MPEISANKMRVDVKSWLHRLPARYCRRQPCRTLISRQVSTKEFQRERFRLPTGQLLNSPLQSSGMTTSLSRSRMYDSEKRSSERHEQESRPYLPVEKKTQGSQVKRITHVCIYIYIHAYILTYVSYKTEGIGCFLSDLDQWVAGTTCYASWYEFIERWIPRRSTRS